MTVSCRQAFAFCRNVWYAIQGALWDPVKSILAFRNLQSKQAELNSATKDYPWAVELFQVMYWCCIIFPPLEKLRTISQTRPGFRAGSSPTIRGSLSAVVLASRVSSLLMYEACCRTEMVFAPRPPGKFQAWPSASVQRERDRLRATLRKVANSSELHELELMEGEDARESRCCGISFSDRPVHVYLLITLYMLTPWPSHPHPAFPPKFCKLMKLKFWSAIFDLFFYYSQVRDGLSWTDPPWLAKALMALWSLWGLRRFRILKAYWPLERFGVLASHQSPWDRDRIWNDWSFTAGKAFRWDENLDVWSLLQPVHMSGSSLQA